MRTLLVIVAVFTAATQLVRAEVVVPIDSVEIHVNVRFGPDAKSEIVGRLHQGSSMPFVRSVPGWHEVELEGGGTGYIAEVWTRVVGEERTVEAPAIREKADVVTPEAAVAEVRQPSHPEAAAAPAQDPDDSGKAADDAALIAPSVVAEEAEEVVAPIAEPLAELTELLEPESVPMRDAVTEDEAEMVTAVAAMLADATEPAVETESIVETESTAKTEPLVLPGPPGPQGPPGPPGSAGIGTIEGTTDYLMKFTAPNIGGNSQVFENGRNIGIGTTEPKQRLEVNGNIQIHERNSSVAGLIMTQSSGESGYIMHNRGSTLTIGAGSVDRITIDRDGHVGFGMSRPQHPLDMASGAHVSAGGVWTNSSSIEKKENVRELTPEEALIALAELQPVRFNYIEDKQEEYLGFIAEDVPDLVATSDRKGLSAMDLVAVLTKVVQAQQQQIDELESRLNESGTPSR